MTLGADFAAIDRRIEDQQAKFDGCRQAMTLSRAAIVVALATLALVLTVAGTYRTPTVVFAAVAALVGGTVWLGANRSSMREAADELAALDAVKNRMIDEVSAHNGWQERTLH